MTKIGNYAFSGCTSLDSLIIEDGSGTLTLGYNDYINSSMKGEGLFHDCPLKSLYLGRNLSYNTDKCYGYGPFYEAYKLTSVTIGSSVTSIGKYAFSFSGLESITSLATTPPEIDYDTFGFSQRYDGSHIYETATLEIPIGSYDSYKSSTGWEEFFSIQEIDVTSVENIKNDNNVVELSRYSLDGRKLTIPSKGINIIRMSDGSVKKVIVR